jgi:hypothetical protein
VWILLKKKIFSFHFGEYWKREMFGLKIVLLLGMLVQLASSKGAPPVSFHLIFY